jgi:hypothetical protein
MASSSLSFLVSRDCPESSVGEGAGNLKATDGWVDVRAGDDDNAVNDSTLDVGLCPSGIRGLICGYDCDW